MAIPSKIRYLTYDQLIKINSNSIKAKRNRTLVPKSIKKLGKDLRFPVIFSMIHNDVEMRVNIVLTEDPIVATLDMSFDEYDSLSEHEVNSDSTGEAVPISRTNS